MVDYAAAAAMMDAGVDSYLGDSIMYSIAGAPAVPLKAFLIDPADSEYDLADAPVSTVGRRLRLKIGIDKVAAPSSLDRITVDPVHPHPLLVGATWRPTARRPTVNGRYWIFDLEKTL